MSAISLNEFAHLFASCKPPIGWSRNITVALSGGPDSLCLLYLLTKHISPTNGLRSITIDHGLQANSLASAQRTHARSLAMGVPNIILPAAWDAGDSIGPNTAVEESARKARYKALWQGLWDQDSPDDGQTTQTLTFAHHADDQLETVIMRTMHSTNTYGLGGMRAVRRWGLTEQGMRTWLCRPLLGVSKDRILATCKASNLEYEQDNTNFMPDFTVRNAIRYALSRPEQPPANEKIGRAINRIRAAAGEPGDVEQMRKYVARMAERVVQVDREVDAYLRAYTHPSPPSTLLLAPSDQSVELEPDAQVALIHRVLRYVSPHPWGSLESEAGRRRESTARIARYLFQSSTGTSDVGPFAAGAQVLWTPVLIKPDGTFRRLTSNGREGVTQGWLASRQPPSAAASRALEIQFKPGLELLWDNRFLARVGARESVLPVLIRPRGRLVFPEIFRRLKDGAPELIDCETRFIRKLDAI